MYLGKFRVLPVFSQVQHLDFKTLDPLKRWFSISRVHQNHLEALLIHGCGSHPSVRYSGSEQGPINYIANDSQVILMVRFWDHTMRTTVPEKKKKKKVSILSHIRQAWKSPLSLYFHQNN